MTTPAPSPSQPLTAIEKLWAKLGLVYGHRFLAQYDGLKLLAVKEDWRRRLAGLSQEQLDYAMENLTPGKPPPDVLEFRRMATAMPDERRLMTFQKPANSRVVVPPRLRSELARLAVPPEVPGYVQTARNFIAQWEAEAAKPEDERLRPTPLQQQFLRAYRVVIARYERKHVDPAKQAADDARVESLSHHDEQETP